VRDVINVLFRHVLGAVFFAFVAGATVCRADDGSASQKVTGAFEVVRPIGAVYDERNSDGGGDAYPESLGVRGYAAKGKYALWFDYRRNVYLTEQYKDYLTTYPRLEGGYGMVTPFLARDSSFEARFERELGIPTVYAGIGFDHTWANYNYPQLRGFGAGLEKRAIDRPGIRPFGSIFYYPWTSGLYTTETPPIHQIDENFRILKIDYGFRVQTRSPVYFVAGYGNEFRRARGLPAQIRFIRSDTSLGLGIRL
jgi:hypothetical protein